MTDGAENCDLCGGSWVELALSVDGALSPDCRALVEERRRRCAQCRRALELHEAVAGALAALHSRAPSRAVLLPADLAESVRHRVCRRGRQIRIVMGGCAAAAALLLLSFFAADWRGPGLKDDSGVVVEEESVISDLDVLVAFVEEGMEPTAELVSFLLEMEDLPEDEPEEDEDLLDFFLEEELDLGSL